MLETKFAVSRVNPRFSFIAEAEITALPGRIRPRDVGSGSGHLRMTARVLKLSARGCYVGTINPFPPDTQLLLRIRYACSLCQALGKVIYTHSGRGMGVLFGEIAAVHRITLDGWLEELARKLGDRSAQPR